MDLTSLPPAFSKHIVQDLLLSTTEIIGNQTLEDEIVAPAARASPGSSASPKEGQSSSWSKSSRVENGLHEQALWQLCLSGETSNEFLKSSRAVREWDEEDDNILLVSQLNHLPLAPFPPHTPPSESRDIGEKLKTRALLSFTDVSHFICLISKDTCSAHPLPQRQYQGQKALLLSRH